MRQTIASPSTDRSVIADAARGRRARNRLPHHIQVDGSAGDFTDDGTAAELGLHLMQTYKLELNGRGDWTDAGNDESGGGAGTRD